MELIIKFHPGWRRGTQTPPVYGRGAMVLEKEAGPEILLWAFWGEIKSAIRLTPMCQSPVSCLTLLPTPHLPQLGFACDSWSLWKALEGYCRTGGRDNSGYGFSLLSASGAGVPLWLQIPEGRTTAAPVSAP